MKSSLALLTILNWRWEVGGEERNFIITENKGRRE
jgi:hypothetical protein